MEAILKPTKLCHNCFKPHQHLGIYCPQCDKNIKNMNELLEKAKRDYPHGTNFRSMYDGELTHNSSGVIDDFNGSIYVKDEYYGWWRCIYDKEKNKWAEIINQSNMTQQEFNDLKVGDFINNYEILHKYKEFLIVRCEDGHDLFDLNKINKLGLKVKPKTFMGLEIKKYDNVPCEINGNFLTYLIEIKENSILIAHKKNGEYSFAHTPTSIRIL